MVGYILGSIRFIRGGGYGRWIDPSLTERAEALGGLRKAHFMHQVHRGPIRMYADALRAALCKGSQSTRL